jgi:hypothetical protein
LFAFHLLAEIQSRDATQEGIRFLHARTPILVSGVIFSRSNFFDENFHWLKI